MTERITDKGAPFLEVQGLTRRFHGVVAVNEVSFQVQRGEIVGLIGPNGAGKTTTFNLISGRFPSNAGSVRLQGQLLTGLRPDQIAACGIARTFQGARVFPKLSVAANVEVGAMALQPLGLWADWLGGAQARAVQEQARQRSQEVLAWTGLAELAEETAGSLSYAHQSLLGIAIALALKPQLLLLDEPFAGMNTTETQRAANMVRRIRDAGITVVLVEHDVPSVMRICDRIVVLDQGSKIAEGTPQEVRAHERVIQAYLGVEDDA
jgi:branched-chain amino acid transport system ATP-binding protein